MSKTPIEQARAFLDALFAQARLGLYAELRLLRPPFHPQRRWIRLPLDLEADKLLSWALAQSHAAGWAAYVGVQPRNSHRQGDADAVDHYAALALDLDSTDATQHALKLLRAVDLHPSALVSSGRGAHAYLFLDQLTPKALAQPIAQRLCYWTGSDSVFDPPRILRLPGSLNHKPQALRPCELISCHPWRRYSLAFVAAVLDLVAPRVEAPPPRPATDRAPLTSAVPSPLPQVDIAPEHRVRLRAIRDRLPRRMLELLIHGPQPADHYPSRSEAEYAVVRALVNAGADADDVQVLFALGAIGERNRERGGLDKLIAKVLATHDPGATVRILDVRRDWPADDRVLFDLEVLDGRFEGAKLVAGFSFGTPARDRAWSYFWSSIKSAPSSAGLYADTVGRTGRVALERDGELLSVVAWRS